jgi:hypothetical protein
MNLTQAKKITGSMGYPSKLPGSSYGLSAYNCIAGKELAKIPGSICSDCYALRDIMSWPPAQKAYAKRLEGIGHPDWVSAMVTVLRHLHAKPYIKIDLGLTGVRRQRNGGSRFRLNPSGYHRWHDSGDLQSVEHLTKIVEVCQQTPRIKHWLPTRELSILRAFKGEIPDNLVIRVSATMFDGLPPAGWPNTSTVHTRCAPEGAYDCPAHEQGNNCQNCRACWSKEVSLVSYLRH